MQNAHMTTLQPDITMPSLNEHIFYCATPFISSSGAIIDIQADNGDNIAPFVQACEYDQRFVLYNSTKEARKRFKNDTRVLCQGSQEPYSAALTLSIFALQRLPVRERQRAIDWIYTHTMTGGAFILVEQTLPETSQLADIFGGAAYSLGIEQHVGQNIIPVTALWNWRMLHDAGFSTVECFYRSFNIAAFVAIRSK